jgi:hypothetical protein
MKRSLGRLVGMVIVLVGARQGLAGVINVGIGLGYDYNTIQGGIDAASDGDRLVVAPGTYYENIDFSGKNITLTSTSPMDRRVVDATIIDGSRGAAPVVRFLLGENRDSVLQGFTITGGTGYGGVGGGILVGPVAVGAGRDLYRSPTIQYNVITGNQTTQGAGIAVTFRSSPLIQYNLIAGNTASYGGGIMTHGDWVGQYPYPIIADNLIVSNTANYGSAFMSNAGRGMLASNTIAENNGGPQIYGWAAATTMVNNIIAFGAAGGILDPWSYLSLSHNCLFNGQFDYSGRSPGPTDVLMDPLLMDAASGDFHLRPDSPCIDAGDTFAWAPTVDLDGNPRIVNGLIDIGAYEGSVPEPSTLIVWSLLGGLGIAVGWRRRKRTA